MERMERNLELRDLSRLGDCCSSLDNGGDTDTPAAITHADCVMGMHMLNEYASHVLGYSPDYLLVGNN